MYEVVWNHMDSYVHVCVDFGGNEIALAILDLNQRTWDLNADRSKYDGSPLPCFHIVNFVAAGTETLQ